MIYSFNYEYCFVFLLLIIQKSFFSQCIYVFNLMSLDIDQLDEILHFVLEKMVHAIVSVHIIDCVLAKLVHITFNVW